MDKPVPVRLAAQVTGAPRKSIYDWVRKGAIPRYTSPGGRLLVRPQDCLPRRTSKA